MPEPRGWSLRTRLLVLLVCLAAALFGTSAVLNWRAHHEASDRLFDDSLRGSAHLLLQLAEHEMAEHGEVLGLALLQAETQPGPAGFHFQIWTPDMLAAAGAGAGAGSALQAPLLPFAAEVERFGLDHGKRCFLAFLLHLEQAAYAPHPDRAGADAARGAGPARTVAHRRRRRVPAGHGRGADVGGRRCHIQAAASHGGQRG
jgi:hypothetical protein